MGINLPSWEELSRDEQVPIVNLPTSGRYVISGGPGTGKTVLALYRASRWRKENPEGKITFLVYNRTLHQYMQDAAEEMNLPDKSVNTWHSWFYSYYYEKTGESVPEVRPYRPDWNKVSAKLTPKPELDFLILDEIQDFPVELLRILNKTAKAMTVFGDPQQEISNHGSTEDDWIDAMDALGRVYYLTRNYRSTEQISKVAELFFYGTKKQFPKPTKKAGPKPRLIKCQDRDDVLDTIANFAENNRGLHVGVLLPPKNIKEKLSMYKQGLQRKTDVPIQIYTRDEQVDYSLSFKQTGIKIMSYLTAKGLEFDAVFLPEVDAFSEHAQDREKRRIYVAITRAKTNLTFLYTRETDSFVLTTLKQNSEIFDVIDNTVVEFDELPF